MNAALGESAVLLSLLGAVAGIVTLVVGQVKGRPSLVRVGRSYTWVILAGAVIATIAMQRALIGHDFSLSYVAHNDSRGTPLLFRITAMWSALEGSILLWSLILAGYLGAVAIHFRKRIHEPIVGWATAVGYAVAAFFFGLMLTVSNPFSTVSGSLPTDGPGPDPLLQNHILVAFHPPILYLGLVGFTVPFCFAVASLITGRVGEGWMAETRRWTLFAWAFLSGGIVLGAWWSYQVLGWGGYWAWDPVENAAFIPWLTATAYLHSVMVQQRRGMLRVWNLSLIMATFSLTILGTFLTRSGVLASVHSFSVSAIGPVLLGFFGVVVASAVGLLMWRGDRLRSPGRIDSPLSREGAFLANNVAFGAFAFVVLLGTVFPLIAEALNGDRLSVGAPYFDSMTAPVGFTLLFLMAVAPALPWRKASGELLHKRLMWPAWTATLVVVACVAAGLRGLAPLTAFGLGAFAAAAALRQLVLSARAAHRQGSPVWRGLVGRANGGMVVHIGVVVIAVAFAASHAYGHRHEFRLEPGQTAHLAGHSVTYLGTTTSRHANKTTLSARVRLDGAQVYEPSLHQFPNASQAIGSPSVRVGVIDDVYLTLVAAPDGDQAAAVVGVNIQPLIAWLWIGGGLMGFGTALAAWPGRRRRPTEPSSAPAVPKLEKPEDPVIDEAPVAVGPHG